MTDQLTEAELAETAARELCVAAYRALLDSRRDSKRNAVTTAAYCDDLSKAEERHWTAVDRLWRARAQEVVHA